MTEDTLEAIIQEADKDGDEINYDEFVAMMQLEAHGRDGKEHDDGEDEQFEQRLIIVSARRFKGYHHR